MRISVLDTGIGNIKSVYNMIVKVGGDIDIISSPDKIAVANAIILPGVGAFDHCIKILSSKGWLEAISEHALVKKKNLLGICMGMQIMTRGSEEGTLDGLGFVEADTVKFNFSNTKEKKKIPNMGWNSVKAQKDNKLFEPGNESEFYFANSYHVVCDNEQDILTTTNYGYNFVSSFQKENIIGVQFHPEKSHKYGYDFFKKLINHFFV